MAYISTYTGDGNTTAYTIPFGYIDSSHLVVTVGGVTKTLNTDFTLTSASTLTFGTAPLNGEAIKIERVTATNALVTYQQGALISADDLNTTNTQAVYVSEEAKGVSDAAKTSADAAVASANTSAATVSNNIVAIQAASGNAAAAAASEAAAATSETNAGNFATSASTSMTNAAVSRSAAETAKTAAETAQTAAETAETNAASSATAAASSATSASTSATSAEASKNAITGLTAATGAAGSSASYNSSTGVLTVPRGDTGATGAQGPQGATGPQGPSVTIKDEGTALSTDASSLDFVGASVTASGTGADKTITISSDAANLTGTLPAIDGSNLTGVQAASVNVTESSDDNATYNILFSDTSNSGTVQMTPVQDDNGLTFNPSTNRLYSQYGQHEQVGIDSYLYHNGDTNTWLRFDTNDSIQLGTDGTTRLHLNNSGADITGNITVSGTVDGRDIATNIPASLGTAGQVLTVNSGASAAEWADASGGGGASNYTIDQKTSSYTIVSGDLGKVIEVTASSNTTITLPEISGSGIGSGFYVTIWNQSGSTVTVSRSGSDQINPNTSSHADTSDNLSSGASKTYVANSNSRWIALSSSPYFYDENNVNNGNNRPQATGISSIAIGRGASSSAANSVAIGGSSGWSGASASANGSVALSGSRAHGADSFAMGISNNTTSYGSGGANSVAMGYRAKATGNHNIALGGTSQATGSDYSVAIGYMAKSNNHSSVAIGREAGASGLGTSSIAIGHEVHTSSAAQAIAIGKSTIANGWYSVALGNYARTNGIQGKFAYSCDYINNGGDAQTGMYVLNASTTDATATALTTTGTSAGWNNQLIVQNNSAYAFHGTIVARQKASEGTASAAWKVEGLIRREGSAGTTVLVNSATTVLDNTPNWGMALSADTTNGCLKVAVTGAASTNIRWVGTINTSELTYA